MRKVREDELEESVETLRDFINSETEYAVQANETIHGLGESKAKQKSFFGEKKIQSTCKNCQICGGLHKVWECEKFKAMNIEQRWMKAKEAGLCFRCLKDNHLAKLCKFKGKCGINGCSKTHNRMLHKDVLNAQAADFIPAEQAEQKAQNFSVSNANCVALRTIPVVIRVANRELRVNALLDDGSTKSYVNETYD